MTLHWAPVPILKVILWELMVILACQSFWIIPVIAAMSISYFIIISLAPWFMFSEFVNGTCWQNDFAVHICGTQHLWQGIYVEVDAGIHSYHTCLAAFGLEWRWLAAH